MEESKTIEIPPENILMEDDELMQSEIKQEPSSIIQ